MKYEQLPPTDQEPINLQTEENPMPVAPSRARRIGRTIAQCAVGVAASVVLASGTQNQEDQPHNPGGEAKADSSFAENYDTTMPTDQAELVPDFGPVIIPQSVLFNQQ